MTTLSLRLVLAVAIGGIALSLTFVRGMIVERQVETLLMEEAGRSFAQVAHTMADKLEADMRSRAALISVLAKSDVFASPRVAAGILDELVAREGALAWVGVTDVSGTVVASSSGILKGVSLAGRPVFIRGREGLFLGDVHDAVLLATALPNPSGEAMKFVDVAAPLWDADGRFKGVLAAHYSWTWATRLAGELLESVKDRSGVEVFVTAADGTVLIGPPSAIGRKLPLNEAPRRDLGADGFGIARWENQREYLTGVARGAGERDLEELGWSVIVRQPIDEAFARSGEARRTTQLTGFGFAMIFAAAGWLVAHILTRPLVRITRAAKALRAGETGVIIPTGGGTSEVETLSIALRALLAALTEHKAELVRMRDAAYQDRLTSLPNRRFFDGFLEVVPNRHSCAAVLYLDLDGFKPINDRFGHDVGDVVLREVGSRLADGVPRNGMVARLGGDEFAVIIIPESGSPVVAVDDVARRLIETVNAPIFAAGAAHRVGCSIGVSLWPEDARSLPDVVIRADAAMYEAKRLGKNRAFFWRGGIS